jgi:chromosome segregation ATPase
MQRATWALAMAVLVVAAGWGGTVAGQAPAGGDQNVTAALLVEVRGLRQAMERMASAGPRIQLALGRLQLQEQRVNTMLRRHDDVKAQIASIETQVGQVRDSQARLDQELRRVTNPEVRENLEEEGRMMKLMLERLTTEQQRLQVEEVAVAQAVASEQSRWMDINARLEALERELQK